MTPPLHILVLAGGPDAEHEVSLQSSQCVADALAKNPRFKVTREVIGRVDAPALRALKGEVIFPALHGPFGEGGPMQDLLTADGRPFVGCGPRAARLAMDKIATKLTAARAGIPTNDAAILNTLDAACPFPLPVVVKPVHEGSSVGLHICPTESDWRAAFAAAQADRAKNPSRIYMVERAVTSPRELTVGVLDGKALPPILITPKSGVYDYDAKYNRDDTRYEVGPTLPGDVTPTIQRWAEALAGALGVRHLCRVDFLLDRQDRPWLLEVNTLPGFTSHSLFPMAAAAVGMDFTALTTTLIDLALRDHPARAD